MNVDAALTAYSEPKPLRSFLPPKPSYPDYLVTIPELELWGFPCVLPDKISACSVGGLGLTLGWENSLEKGKATHSSILAWRIL